MECNCFAPTAMVAMSDGGFRRIATLAKGNIVASSKGATEVECITWQMCKTPNNFTVYGVFTGTHPVIVSEGGGYANAGANAYAHPRDIFKQFRIVSQVYNLVLANRADVFIANDGVIHQAVTLGHGIVNDRIASHPFFGTDHVVNSLKRADSTGYKKGFVDISSLHMLRDYDGWVTGIVS
jgi:hypothetical protein